MKFLIKFKTILLLLFFIPHLLDAQQGITVSYSETKVALHVDSIKRSFGNKKKIPAEFTTAFYTAISHYDELKSVRIKIKSSKIKTTMAARPTFLSSFRKAKNRRYVIFVNPKSKNGAPLYSEFTFNARVGIIGHELAHILHYTQTGFFRLASEGINYRKKDFKSTYEKATDSITIAHGLGWQVYDFTSQLHAKDNLPESYRNFKLNIYYSPREILGLMSEMGYTF